MNPDTPDRSIHAEHRMCRVFQHAWEYTTVAREGKDYLQGLICIRCGTERIIKINARTGELGGARYRYAEGYLIHGGAMTADERADLRLAEVAGHMPVRRRRRK